MYIVALNDLDFHLQILTNVMPQLAFAMWTLTAKTLWDRIAALAELGFLVMDVAAKVGRNLIKNVH